MTRKPSWFSYEYFPEAVSFREQPCLYGGCPDLASEFQCPVRPYEVVVAVQKLKVIFEAFSPSWAANGPPRKVCCALSHCEIQPFDERFVQFGGVLGVR